MRIRPCAQAWVGKSPRNRLKGDVLTVAIGLPTKAEDLVALAAPIVIGLLALAAEGRHEAFQRVAVDDDSGPRLVGKQAGERAPTFTFARTSLPAPHHIIDLPARGLWGLPGETASSDDRAEHGEGRAAHLVNCAHQHALRHQDVKLMPTEFEAGHV